MEIKSVNLGLGVENTNYTKSSSEAKTTCCSDTSACENVRKICIDSNDEDAVLSNELSNCDENVVVCKSGSSKSKAEKKLAKLEKKLEKLESKLASKDSDKKQAKLEKKIDKVEGKIEYYQGLVDSITSSDNKLNKLYAKKYKA